MGPGSDKVQGHEHSDRCPYCIVLSCAAVFYTRVRFEDRLARLFRAVVELVLLAFFTGGLSYTAAALNRPLWDSVLNAWDQRLGFHWRVWLDLLNAHPGVNVILVVGTHSMVPQLALVLIALVTVRAYRTIDAFLIAFGCAASVSVAVSAVIPALSPLVHYGLQPSDYPNISLAVPMEFADQVRALRDGSMRMIDLSGAQGLVTFPSFSYRVWCVADSGLMASALCSLARARPEQHHAARGSYRGQSLSGGRDCGRGCCPRFVALCTEGRIPRCRGPR